MSISSSPISSFPLSSESYISNNIDNSCTLFISGIGSNNYMPLFVGNLDNLPLYTYGHESGVYGVPLFIGAILSRDSGRALYISGPSGETDNTPLFITGPRPAPKEVPLYLQGSISSSGYMTLYTSGIGLGNNNITLYIGDLGNRIENSMTLFLKNPGSDSGLPLVVWGEGFGVGPDETEGGIPVYNSIYLFIRAAGAEKNVPLYMNTPTGTVDNTMNLTLGGLQVPLGSIPLVMADTIDFNIDTMKLYSHGF